MLGRLEQQITASGQELLSCIIVLKNRRYVFLSLLFGFLVLLVLFLECEPTVLHPQVLKGVIHFFLHMKAVYYLCGFGKTMPGDAVHAVGHV